MPKELNEEDIFELSRYAGRPAIYDDDYKDIDKGAHITIWTQPTEYSPSIEAYRVKLTALKAGEYALLGATGSPPNKLFVGQLLRTTASRRVPDLSIEHADAQPRGVLFPNGSALLLDFNHANL